MNETQNQNRHEAPNPADLQGTWLISFADLITLLLCAFLMMFSINWKKTQSVTNMSKDDSLAHQTESHGIVIAQSSVEGREIKPLEHRVEIRFLKTDLTGNQGTLSLAVMDRVKNTMISEGYQDSAVTFSLCNEAQGTAEGLNRNSELLRVVGQLIDAGVSEKRLRIEVLGSDCSAGRDNSNPATVGRLIFERDV